MDEIAAARREVGRLAQLTNLAFRAMGHQADMLTRISREREPDRFDYWTEALTVSEAKYVAFFDMLCDALSLLDDLETRNRGRRLPSPVLPMYRLVSLPV